MTTLVLQAADAAMGGLARGATAFLGQAALGLVAGTSGRGGGFKAVEGPRLSEMNGLASTEGAPIPRLYGRARIGGQLIWATRFEEVAATSVERQASRGGKSLGSSKAATTVTTSYAYYANLAIGLCEGPIAFVRRVWADGREVDLTTLSLRVHPGTEDQGPDPLVVAKEGAENAPAYRGLAYLVFERLPLAPFGNRVPQFSFEVVRPVDGLGGMIRSVCLIPGASEFAYDTIPVRRILGLGASAPENTHQFQRLADVTASLDQLQALCPNLEHVSLVVSWFGDDLRAGHCTVAPRIEHLDKATDGVWSVAAVARAGTREVSRVAGQPAYGGTPSDAAVVRLIQDLKGRGLAVTLYPFLMMDIPAGNALPDPRTGAVGQPPYPWRGRITCDPAPGATGTVDGSATAIAQVNAFFGGAGPGDWSFRRLVTHYAGVAVQAGGVDGFIIGSEMVGLTRVRSGPGAYPAVGALRSLAGEVRAILGSGTKLTYAADWTEYGAHVLDGGVELRFPLDPLWADAAIDAVGIDDYAPISDWRDGPGHLDGAEARSVYDVDYLRGRIGSGEAFDWFYASDADRAGQVRTPITDGAFGKPWVFRPKDLVGWWSNPHVERAGGIEIGATAWQPGSKPIWLTEIGVPAVDKGANGPNVFPDPKSSESAVPPFSRGTRDDLMQARGLEATLSRFDPALPGHRPSFNPLSAVYGGRMVDSSRISVWAWDARPFPAFPSLDLVWADGANWEAGHWITGRLEGVPLDRLVRAIAADYGIDPGAEVPLDGFVDGYVVDRPMSLRAALEPLQQLFGFDAAAGGGVLRWRGRGGRVDATVSRDDLVEIGKEPLLSRSRAQETELPASIELGFTDGEGEYGRAAVGSRRVPVASRREDALSVAVVTHRAEAQRLVDIRLQDTWAGRESAAFALSPRRLDLEPGDVVAFDGLPGGGGPHRIGRIVDGPSRRIETQAVEPAIFEAPTRPVSPPRRRAGPSIAGAPEALVLDLPAAPGDPMPLQHLAVAADPWPGALAVWRSAQAGSFALHAVVEVPAIVGRTLTAFAPGPVWLLDRGTRLEAEFSAPALSSIDDLAMFASGNLFAVRGADGEWEVVSAASVETIGARSYRLSRMLRGLGGTEHLASRPVPAGAPIVRLDETMLPLSTSPGDLGVAYTYRIGPADRDHADPTYISRVATVGSRALAPLAPVRARARRGVDGVTIAWIRRTRLSGDAWELTEVPLGEETEGYALDVKSGSAVVRTLGSATNSVLYPADHELADFGAPQSTLSVRIAQISAAVGLGRPLATTLPIH